MRTSRSGRFLAFFALGIAVAIPSVGRAAAPTLAYERVVTGLSRPTAFAFAPDGRIFVAELRGVVDVVQNGVVLPTPFITLPTNFTGERGLLGLALDPAFATNNYMYLYYTVETDATNPEGPKTNRLSRVTANGNVAVPGSELVLLGTVQGTPDAPSCEDQPPGSDCLPVDTLSHVGGGLRFGPDHMLYVGTGDGSVIDKTIALHRAQGLDSLAGKLLRIQPQDGRGPADNPFYDGDPTANRAKVWAYGFRHPFRFAIHPTAGLPLVGDVGESSFEEIDVAIRGVNQGWPCFEGPGPAAFVATDPICTALYDDPPANLGFPLYTYPHLGSAAVIGGVFDIGTRYPAPLSGGLFFGDYAQSLVQTLRPGPPPITPTFGAALDTPVDFEVGLDGFVYALSITDGAIYRLVPIATNVAPIAQASVTPLAGLAPLAVQFSSDGTLDPNGDPLQIQWTFGDGASSTQADPTHTYTQVGSYYPTFVARDPDGASDTVQLRVLVGRQPPTIAITSPLDGLIYRAGDPITVVSDAEDADDGPLSGSHVSWVIRIIHCEFPVPDHASCHAHPFLETTGSTVQFTAPNHGNGTYVEFFFLDIVATATDSDGIATSARIRIGPDLDADGCMDLYTPASLAVAPFQGSADQTTSASGGGFPFANHSWSPTGVISDTAIAAAPPNGSASSNAHAQLTAPFTATEEGDYAINFDAFLGGVVGILPGPTLSSASLTGTGSITTSTGAPVGQHTLFSYELDDDEPESGDFERTLISVPHAELPLVVHLTPGTYQWSFTTVAQAQVSSGASNTTVGAAASSMTLRQARICQQRLPDSDFP